MTDTPESLRALADKVDNLPERDMSAPWGRADTAIEVDAADALRRAADRLEAEGNGDGETIAFQAYQVIGALAFDLPDTPEIVRALDYFSAGKFDASFLPWRRDWLDEAPEDRPADHSGDVNKMVSAARREGAEEMRERAAALPRRSATRTRDLAAQMKSPTFFGFASELDRLADSIHALPLPGDPT